MIRCSPAERITIFIAMAAMVAAHPAVASDTPTQSDYTASLRRTVLLDDGTPQRFSIQDRMAHYAVPGVSVAVVEGCRVVDARAFGNATPAGTPVTVGTQFQAGSISKVVTAAGALALVDGGILSLDKDIAGYLHGWELPRPAPYENASVTLRHLLTHSAGLNVAGFKGYPIGTPLPSLVQVLDGQAPANTEAVRMVAAPGAGWRYSGGGITLTQKLMEDASGRPFQDLMRERVLQPAGMLRSSFAPSIDPSQAIEPAHGTLADGTPVPNGWRLYREQAAAGLWSTPSDLSRLGIALVDAVRGKQGALLTPATATDMLRRQVGAWGLGLEVSSDGSPRKFSHTGAPVGYRTLWLMFPDTCQGATIMTNADEGMALTHEVARALADAYHWPDPMTSELASHVAMTPDIANRFIGAYQLRDFPTERFEVERQDDGALTWARQGRGRKALDAASADQLLSPDSGMRLVALEHDQADSRVTVLELRFPGGVNIALRVESVEQRSPANE